MPIRDTLQREVLPIPDRKPADRTDDLRREESGHEVPTDPPDPSAARRTERAGGADRRHRLRIILGVRWSVPET